MGQRLLSWLQIAAGLMLLAAAGILYSDLLGFTNNILVHEGFLSFRLPWSGELLQTPLSTTDLWGEVRRLVPIVLVVAFIAGLGIAIRLRKEISAVPGRRPRGWQGVVASLLLLSTLAAFVPLGGESAPLGVYFTLGFVGFSLLILGVRRHWREGVDGGSSLGQTLADGVVALARQPAWVLISVMTLAMFTGASLISAFVFNGVPQVVDGMSHLFQARILASGHFFLPSHPLREFFDVDTIVNNGRWFSQYTPGHTVLLLLGDRVGVPWLVNPVLGALSIPSLYLLGREAYGKPTALLAVLLAVLSPFLVFVSGEYFSHASAFLFLTLFLFHYLRFSPDGTFLNALLAGLFLGLALMSRPLTALAVAVPCAVDSMVLLFRAREARRAAGLAILSALTLAFVGLLLLYNRETTGAFLSFGYGQAAGPGFGWGDTLSWTRTLERVRLLNDALLGWPVPSLALALFAFLGGRPTRSDYIFAGIFLSLLAAYAPVAYQDTEFGPRYLFEASGALLLLSARGYFRMHEGLGRLFGRPFQTGPVRRSVGLAMVILFLFAAVGGWIPRTGFYGSSEWKWARHDDAFKAAQAAGIRNAIVFVREPDRPFRDRWWESVFLQNGLSLDTTDVIFARDLGERNSELMAFYPGRRYFVADTTSLIPLSPP